MGKNLIEKILHSHLVAGALNAGEEIELRVDQTLTQDVLGTMAYLQFETLGVARVKTRSVSYIDHNTLQDGFENADDHRYLQTVADKHGIWCSKAGNGVCHQVHLERFGRPGEVLIGGDSHTPTGGAIGMLAIGVGGLEIAAGMASGRCFLNVPRVIRVNLEGRLAPWVAAKDIALELMRLFTTRGNVGTAIEYGGDALARLSVPERATIANVGAEMGVTTSIFPSDEQTRAFLAGQQREADWIPLAADADARYDRIITLEVDRVMPNIACPHSPDNVRPVAEVAGRDVHQVILGSCTNSSYRDLAVAAAMLKGRRVHPAVSFGIAPGSRQVLSMAARHGLLETFLAAGARLLESACGFCCGCGQSPQSRGVSLRTNNRNYEGRSGTRDAQVYLVGPEVAIAAALTGKITDPRDLGFTPPAPVPPARFDVDDGLIVAPTGRLETAVFRGPNIASPPRNDPLADRLHLRVAACLGDGVTTDHITPAGSLLKYRSNVPKYSEFVLRDLKPDFATVCRRHRAAGVGSAIVAGASYGQGSSREHAALCPMYLGVKLVLAKSVERIHAANLLNFGLLRLDFDDPADHARIVDDDELVIDQVHRSIASGEFIVRNLTRDHEYRAHCDYSRRQREILLSGGLLNFFMRPGA